MGYESGVPDRLGGSRKYDMIFIRANPSHMSGTPDPPNPCSIHDRLFE